LQANRILLIGELIQVF